MAAMPLISPVRVFIALPLSSGPAAELVPFYDQLRRRFPSDLVRWTPPAQWHLTLRFLGDVAPENLSSLELALRQACSTQVSFQMQWTRIGGFPTLDQPQVIWLGLAGELEQLAVLQEKVSRETAPWGGPLETREFHPHLTLGRVRLRNSADRRAIGKRLRSLSFHCDCHWDANQVILMRSDLTPNGAVHVPLAVVPLLDRSREVSQSPSA
jgi:RNA 2',3'-cyclic 3'-phosphodiesterase